MALLLSLETSTHSFSCALHRDSKLIAFEESLVPQSTASLLAVMIENLFSISDTSKNDLNAVVVASGPGSYTGLRIGVATAKGICFVLNIPLVSVNTLSLMVHQFVKEHSQHELQNSILCSMLDARRMEVYCLQADARGTIIEQTQAKVIDENSFADQLERQAIYFFGEGSDKCKNVIHHGNAKFVSGLRPSASSLGEMGFKKLLANDFENISFFEPFYLKDFVIKKPKSVS